MLDFLLEIGVEELPPLQLPLLSQALEQAFTTWLAQQQLPYQALRSYASPRRLAIQILGLAPAQADRVQERLGPKVTAAFLNGEPTAMAHGFAKSCGVTVAELQRKQTAQGEVLAYTIVVSGVTTTQLLTAAILPIITGLPLAKHMRWDDSNLVFARPVRWLVAMVETAGAPPTALPVQLGALTAACVSYGHRFHSSGPIHLSSVRTYSDVMREHYVVACAATRKQLIVTALEELAEQEQAQAVYSEELLTMVNGLVEYPVALLGSFSEEFLALPMELLIVSAQEQQKCFPLMRRDKDGKEQLLAKFIIISNIASQQPTVIQHGNTRVMQARLSDAKFLFEADLQQPLAQYAQALDKVIFLQGLGSMYAKSQRIGQLSHYCSTVFAVDPQLAEQAGLLAKADLATQLVGEFPSLQGIMGAHYAAREAYPAALVVALREQYLPKAAQDVLPSSPLGQCLSFADKIDTLVCFFALKKYPSADKDPFALKRQALAIIRIIIENAMDFDLRRVIEHAATLLPVPLLAEPLLEFFIERLRYLYPNFTQIPVAVFYDLAARIGHNMYAIYARVQALTKLAALPNGAALIALHKRVHKLLEKQQAVTGSIMPETLVTASERALQQTLAHTESTVDALLAKAAYLEILTSLGKLEPVVAAFFADTMVLCEELTLRTQRLLLLQQLNGLLHSVADLSLL
jgi:glycyl-tRNA synthetase beta chain